ncbi:MAG TPA: hypothetical protein DHV25_02545 [Candidatus Kerfeldbacteria bacterium]|nr:hypothetical protein [Candidatus Kerfeldbacteria bacterium]
MPETMRMVARHITHLLHTRPWQNDEFPKIVSVHDKIRWILETVGIRMNRIRIPLAVWAFETVSGRQATPQDIGEILEPDKPEVIIHLVSEMCEARSRKTISRISGISLTISEGLRREIDETPTHLRIILRHLKLRIKKESIVAEKQRRARIEELLEECRSIIAGFPDSDQLQMGVFIWMYRRISGSAGPTLDTLTECFLATMPTYRGVIKKLIDSRCVIVDKGQHIIEYSIRP